MRAVNLLPREILGRRTERRGIPLVAGGAALTVAVVVALGSGYALERSHASSAQSRLATARTELSRLEAEARQGSGAAKTPTVPTPAVIQQQVPWQAALTSAIATRVAWDDVLAQLARVVPANVTITTVSLGAAASTSTTTTTLTPGSSGALELGGTAFSEDGVALLLSRLGLVPDLGDIALVSSAADPKTGVVTFTISAQVGSPTSSAVAMPAPGASS